MKNSEEKRRWRNRAWDQLAKLLSQSKPVREGVAVFLLGPKPHDAAAATSAGFRKGNLVGVSLEQEHVDAGRAAGLNCIRADVFDVIRCWGHFDAALIDVYGGLTDRTLDGLRNVAPVVSALAFNCLRGRDPGELQSLRRLHSDIVATKHRGQWAAGAIATDLVANYGGQLDPTIRDAIDLLEDRFRCDSYRSGKLVYDTMFFWNPLPDCRFLHTDGCDAAVRRRVAAAKAIHTVRCGRDNARAAKRRKARRR